MKKVLALILVSLSVALLFTSCGKCKHVDENNDGKCDECDYNYDHEHTYNETWSLDAENHWREANCAHTVDAIDKASHKDENNDGLCDVCDYDYDHEHQYDTKWSSDAENHWHAPSCGHIVEGLAKAAHKDVNNDGACDVCKYNGGHVHVYDDKWTSNENEHWHKPVCGHSIVVKDKAVHSDSDNNSVCDACGYDYDHEHVFDTEWSSDKTHHWHSVECDHEIEIDKIPHVDADTDGVCDECGEGSVISAPDTDIDLPEIEF